MSYVGYNYKKYMTIKLQLAEYSCNNCCFPSSLSWGNKQNQPFRFQNVKIVQHTLKFVPF